ncbi:MAG: hypothetical protein QOI63_1282 [Thermoplasmata archaeon]|jgi:hypothetical protein|nr:hypothetical protein [Thermoplasmata archaeon]
MVLLRLVPVLLALATLMLASSAAAQRLDLPGMGSTCEGLTDRECSYTDPMTRERRTCKLFVGAEAGGEHVDNCDGITWVY